MRISNNQVAQDAVADLQNSLNVVQNNSLELSTGLAVNEPSDNPEAAGQIVDINSQINQDNGFSSAAQSGDSQLALSSSVLGQVLTLLNSVQTSAETGMNSSTESQTDLNALGTQVNADLGQVLDLANTQQNGQSIFAGFQVGNPAFAATNAGGQIASVAYQGDAGVNQAQVGAQLSVADNLPGGSVFDAAGASVFQSIIGIRNALQSGDQSALAAGLTQLQAAMQTVTSSQAQAGALDQTIQARQTTLTSLQTSLNASLGKIQSANMASVATTYQQALTTYESGIQAAGLVAQLPSIVNYM